MISITKFQRRVVRSLVLGLIFLVLALLGLGFLILAAWIWLSGLFGSQSAALVIGSGSLLLCCLGLLVTKLFSRRKNSHHGQEAQSDSSLASAFLKGFEAATKRGD